MQEARRDAKARTTATLAGDSNGEGSKDKKTDQEGWYTVGRGKVKNEGQPVDLKTKQKAKQSGRKQSPRKKNDGAEGGKKQKRTGKEGDAAPDDRAAIFEQLRNYVVNDDPPEYILQIMCSLKDKGKEQRFNDFLVTLSSSAYSEEAKTVLMGEWADETTDDQKELYKGLQSYWNRSKPEHIVRLGTLLKDWVQHARLTQEELETRLRFMHFEVTEAESKVKKEKEVKSASYLGAVQGGQLKNTNVQRTEVQQRMYELCTQQYTELSKLRKRTDEENEALRMIISHELEVSNPPGFLVQSLDAFQLAKFTDYFMTLEYPMYAHLASGQRFSADMAKGAVLAQINVGTEAAPRQKGEVFEFKISKRAAQRWANWKVPLGRRLLTLVDYEAQREAAKTTHELIRMDYYEFTMVVRKEPSRQLTCIGC